MNYILNRSKIAKTSLIIFLYSVFHFSCTNENNSYLKVPEKQIVRELKQRKIVMLADYGHSAPQPYQSVIAVLNQWLSSITNGKDTFKHLTLILETDEQIINILKQYIESGDLKPVLNFCLPFVSLEDLEFYIDLRRICTKIDSINIDKPSNQNISFDIFGGESGSVFNYPGMLGASKEKSFSFFQNIRDSLIADRIFYYLNNNPINKALIFYGSSHLNKNYTNKDFWNYYPNEKKYGYFLAYYLKKYFGDNQVLSVNQKLIPADDYENTPIEDMRNEAVFSYSDKIKWSLLRPEDYDAFVIKPGNFIPGHSTSLIFSSRIIESSIIKMKEINPYLPGFHAQRYYDISLNTLKFISGKNYTNIPDWEYWFKNEYFPGFQRLDSEEFAEQILELFFSNFNDFRIKQKLFSLGFGPGIMTNNDLVTRDIWLEKIWSRVLPTIKFFNAVGLLLIGYPYEKKIGKEYLVKYTKMDCQNPDEYLKWWRNNFGNVKNVYYY